MAMLKTTDGRRILTETDGSGREVKRRADWQLGLNIREAREAAGYSRAQAARVAGFSTQAWSTLEAGIIGTHDGEGYRANNPAEFIIRRAAEAVGLDGDECMEAAGYESARHHPRGTGPSVHRGRQQPPWEEEAVRMLRALPVGARKAIIRMIESAYEAANLAG